MNVGTLCSRNLVSVSIGKPISEVADLMKDQHVGAVVVTEGEARHARVAGILTDRDIVRAQLARTADLTSLNAAETMTRDPLVLSEEEPIDRAIAHLRARGVRRAPVVGACSGPRRTRFRRDGGQHSEAMTDRVPA